MDVKTVRERVARIAAMDDPEEMHIAEDGLYVDVLRAMAHGEITRKTFMECAVEALRVRDLPGERWYA